MAFVTVEFVGAVRTDRPHNRTMRDTLKLGQPTSETPLAEMAECVHIEHTLCFPLDSRKKPPRSSVMSPYRMRLCLAILGWSERELARRTGRHQTEVRRWIMAISPIDPDVAEWLTALAQFFRDHPAPRLRPMLRPTVREHITVSEAIGAPNNPNSIIQA